MTHDPTLGAVGSTPNQAAPTDKQQADGPGGAAFRALLDELQEKTRRLKEDGEELSEPSELAGAVDRARASIDDARSLSDKLLEAYRAAQQVTDAPDGEEQDARSNA